MTSTGHLDVGQRIALGKEARRASPRSCHASWAPPATRADPVDLLHSQEATRVPELLDIRHERMLQSPFAFYRGAAIVIAISSDLGSSDTFDRAIADFAVAYADQNQRDFEAATSRLRPSAPTV